jgi:hypothetical protein
MQSQPFAHWKWMDFPNRKDEIGFLSLLHVASDSDKT